MPLGEAQHLFVLERRTLSAAFPFVSNISRKVANFVRHLEGKIRGQEMLRASPLNPTKGSAFGIRKPLKRLERNFKCLGEVG